MPTTWLLIILTLPKVTEVPPMLQTVRVQSEEICRNLSVMMNEDSTGVMAVKTYCVPDVKSGSK